MTTVATMLSPMSTKCSICPQEAYGEYNGLMLCSEDISQMAKADRDYVDNKRETGSAFAHFVQGIDKRGIRNMGRGHYQKKAVFIGDDFDSERDA